MQFLPGKLSNENSGANSPMARLPLLVAIIAFAALYVGASKLGFMLAFTAQQVTVVWPPTGISLAAVLLLGDRILPGVALGAFLANVTSHEPVTTALGIAAGNTLEAWVAAVLMRRMTGFSISLGRLPDVMGLVMFSAICGTMLSANIGVFNLCLGGVQPWANYGTLWLLWWLGDATGALIVAPVLLVWLTKPQISLHGRRWELAGLLAMLAASCIAIFIIAKGSGMRGQLFTYAVFTFVIWGALRFGQRGTTLVTLMSSIIAINFAARGMGPFAAPSIEQGLMHLQVFMIVVAVTALSLGAAITERTLAVQALTLSDHRKNEFLAMLAHELRTPLSTLSNALFITRQNNLGVSKSAEVFTVMQRQVEQVTRLVDDLLDVARIAHGKFELRHEHVVLGDIISNALDTIKPLLRAKTHRIGLRFPEQPVLLDADPVRLTQVFVNLLSNAAKYTPPGGQIAIDVGIEPDKAIVRISDNGMGIPPSLLPRVFDLFMQADYSSERSQGGLGIGLTLVKKLVELHGGKVQASSPGSLRGSVFTVQLPRMTQAPAPALQTEEKAAMAS